MMTKTVLILWFMLSILLWPTKAASAAAAANAKPDCPKKCGDVTVPYPFGIDDSNCGLNEHFVLQCNRSFSPPRPMMGNIAILSISVENGTILTSIETANRCYNGGKISGFDLLDIQLGDGPFRFSDTRNKFTAVGCDTYAYMSDADNSSVIGCMTLCSSESQYKNKTGNSCSGIACCQTPLPKSLKTLSITLDSIYNHTKIREFGNCDYAFLADDTFDVSSFLPSADNDGNEKLTTSNVTIEWVVKEETCETGINSTDYACGHNTDCTYSTNGQGYRCLCRKGFQGNPYLGCHDIDECKEPHKYKCEGTCKNTIGNYTCRCPLGMYGDGKIDCRGFRITVIIVVIVAIVFVLVVGVLVFITCRERRKERNFLKNGGVILKHQRVRIFSEAELAKATKNYARSRFIGEGGFGSVYKGVLPENNTVVAVKKPKETENMIQIDQEFEHELGIVFQVNHRNVVKILGICLETRVPLLVYEFVSHGTLSYHIHDKSSQLLKTWKNCLRVAAETALALSYFHSLASPTIIHGDVKPANILLDENYTTKVADFGASVLISRDKTVMVTKIKGTFGYLDPEYLMTGILTEKSDVYSYGVVLVELLTGLKPSSLLVSNNDERINMVQYFLSSIENSNLFQILSFQVADGSEMKEVEIVAELAMKCVDRSGIRRPKMKQVAEELERLKNLHDDNAVGAQENSGETEHVLGELNCPSSSTSVEFLTALTAQSDTQTVISFNSEN